MWSEENVIVRAILVLLKHTRNNIASEMIIAPRRKVTSAQHLLVLNILIGNRQDLSSESKLSQRSCHRIIGKPCVVFIDRGLISLDQRGAHDIAILHA